MGGEGASESQVLRCLQPGIAGVPPGHRVSAWVRRVMGFRVQGSGSRRFRVARHGGAGGKCKEGVYREHDHSVQAPWIPK